MMHPAASRGGHAEEQRVSTEDEIFDPVSCIDYRVVRLLLWGGFRWNWGERSPAGVLITPCEGGG
jgi:hypothetical protein